MITPTITIEQAITIEDALSWLAVSFPERNSSCAEAYLLILNARMDLKVKKMIEENPEAGSNWIEDSKEIA